MQKLKNIIIKEEKRCEAWWKWKKENHKLPENCELSIGRLKPVRTISHLKTVNFLLVG